MPKTEQPKPALRITEGPWTVREHCMGDFVTAPDPKGSMHDVTIAETKPANLGPFYQHQAKSNARAIAAIPKLLGFLNEAANHGYTAQDAQRLQAMAREILASI